MQVLFPLLLLFSLSFLSIYYPPFLGYINIYQNIPIQLEKVRHGRKITANGRQQIPIWLEKVRHGRKITADGRQQIPIWLEKVRHGWKITADTRGKQLKIFPYGWKKSDMVGKLQWMEGDKFQHGGKFPSGGEKRCSVTQDIQSGPSIVQAGISHPLFYQCMADMTYPCRPGGQLGKNLNCIKIRPQLANTRISKHSQFFANLQCFYALAKACLNLQPFEISCL